MKSNYFLLSLNTIVKEKNDSIDYCLSLFVITYNTYICIKFNTENSLIEYHNIYNSNIITIMSNSTQYIFS
jgi:hypothetical protein